MKKKTNRSEKRKDSRPEIQFQNIVAPWQLWTRKEDQQQFRYYFSFSPLCPVVEIRNDGTLFHSFIMHDVKRKETKDRQKHTHTHIHKREEGRARNR